MCMKSVCSQYKDLVKKIDLMTYIQEALSSLFDCHVKSKCAEDRRVVASLAYLVETCGAQQDWQPAFDVVGSFFKPCHDQGDQSRPGRVWLAEVGDVQLAVGSQDAQYLGHRALLVVRGQVVEYQAGKYPVERAVGIREIKRHALIQGDINPSFLRLGPADFQHPGVPVQSHPLRLGESLLDLDSESGRP